MADRSNPQVALQAVVVLRESAHRSTREIMAEADQLLEWLHKADAEHRGPPAPPIPRKQL